MQGLAGPVVNDLRTDLPICGAIDGSCTSDTNEPLVSALFDQWGGDQQAMQRTVLVSRDMTVEDATLPEGKRRYRKGDRLTVEEAQRLGLLPVESEEPPALEIK